MYGGELNSTAQMLNHYPADSGSKKHTLHKMDILASFCTLGGSRPYLHCYDNGTIIKNDICIVVYVCYSHKAIQN